MTKSPRLTGLQQTRQFRVRHLRNREYKVNRAINLIRWKAMKERPVGADMFADSMFN